MPALSSPMPPAAAASCRAYAASAASSCVTRSACTSISPARSIRWRTRSTSRSSATDASELASTADTSLTPREHLGAHRARLLAHEADVARHPRRRRERRADSSTAASTSAARSCAL